MTRPGFIRSLLREALALSLLLALIGAVVIVMAGVR